MAEPTEGVQLLKFEDLSAGGDAADDEPFPVGSNPTEDVGALAGLRLGPGTTRSIYYDPADPDNIKAKDPAHGVVNLLDSAGGGGVTAGQHEALDSLVHNIAESSFLQVVRSGGRVSEVKIWTDSGTTVLIRTVAITRSANRVSSYVEKQKDGAGSDITGQTLTGTITRSGGKIQSIDVVET